MQLQQCLELPLTTVSEVLAPLTPSSCQHIGDFNSQCVAIFSEPYWVAFGPATLCKQEAGSKCHNFLQCPFTETSEKVERCKILLK